MDYYKILIIISSLIILCLGNYYLFELGNRTLDTNTYIYDMGHSLLSDHSQIKDIINYIILIIIIIFLIFNKNGNLKTVFLQIIGYTIPLFLLRLICIFSTILPTINDDTLQSEWKSKYYILGHQFDKVVSGHMTLTIILIYIFSRNTPNLKIVYYILGILQAIFLITTREHYTVDVILAIVITICFIKLNVKIKL